MGRNSRDQASRWIPNGSDQPCRRVADLLESAGEDALDPEVEAHVGRCLRCQAAVARVRRAERWSPSRPGERPPDGLYDAIMAGLDSQGRRRRRTELAAVAAATAGAVYLGRRSRQI